RATPTGDPLLRVEPRCKEGRVHGVVVELNRQSPPACVRLSQLCRGSAAPGRRDEQLPFARCVRQTDHWLGLSGEKTAQPPGGPTLRSHVREQLPRVVAKDPAGIQVNGLARTFGQRNARARAVASL